MRGVICGLVMLEYHNHAPHQYQHDFDCGRTHKLIVGLQGLSLHTLWYF